MLKKKKITIIFLVILLLLPLSFYGYWYFSSRIIGRGVNLFADFVDIDVKHKEVEVTGFPHRRDVVLKNIVLGNESETQIVLSEIKIFNEFLSDKFEIRITKPVYSITNKVYNKEFYRFSKDTKFTIDLAAKDGHEAFFETSGFTIENKKGVLFDFKFKDYQGYFESKGNESNGFIKTGGSSITFKGKKLFESENEIIQTKEDFLTSDKSFNIFNIASNIVLKNYQYDLRPIEDLVGEKLDIDNLGNPANFSFGFDAKLKFDKSYDDFSLDDMTAEEFIFVVIKYLKVYDVRVTNLSLKNSKYGFNTYGIVVGNKKDSFIPDVSFKAIFNGVPYIKKELLKQSILLDDIIEKDIASSTTKPFGSKMNNSQLFGQANKKYHDLGEEIKKILRVADFTAARNKKSKINDYQFNIVYQGETGVAKINGLTLDQIGYVYDNVDNYVR